MTTETEVVAQAEQLIATLHEKQKTASLRAVELADERGRIALSVHGDGDLKARSRLDKINAEISVLASEQASIESAIIASNARANVARAGEALAQDRTKAQRIAALLKQFKVCGDDLSDACTDIVENLNSMISLLSQMAACGQTSPSAEMFRINSVIAIKSMLQELPQHWVRDFEFQRLAPNQKKSFEALVESWTAMIEGNIASRLGDKTTEAA